VKEIHQGKKTIDIRYRREILFGLKSSQTFDEQSQPSSNSKRTGSGIVFNRVGQDLGKTKSSQAECRLSRVESDLGLDEINMGWVRSNQVELGLFFGLEDISG